MLHNIHIQRFRSFEDIKIDQFEQFNLIIGNNDSGKTTLLEAIFLTLNPAGAQLPVNVNLFRNISTDVQSFLSLNFYNLDVSKPIKITAQFLEPNERRTMLIQSSGSANFNDNRQEVFEIDKLSESKSGTTPEASNTFEIQFDIDSIPKKLGRVYIRQRGDTIEARINHDIDIAKSGVFLNSGANKSHAIIHILNATLKKQMPNILKVLQEIDVDIKEVITTSNEVYCDVGLDRMIPIGALGDGLFKTLYILSVISVNPKGYVIIDEIENGLHYKSLNHLWSAIVKFARQNKTQIFASTHSMDCIEAFMNSEFDKDALEGQKRIFRVQKKMAA